MLHQLVFTKLLGEIDYGAGAGGLGDFNAAGCVRPRLREPQVSACAAGPRASQHGCRPGSVCAGSVCAAAVGVCAATLCGSAPAVADGAGVCVGAQLQHGGHLGLERPRRRLDLPGLMWECCACGKAGTSRPAAQLTSRRAGRLSAGCGFFGGWQLF